MVLAKTTTTRSLILTSFSLQCSAGGSVDSDCYPMDGTDRGCRHIIDGRPMMVATIVEAVHVYPSNTLTGASSASPTQHRSHSAALGTLVARPSPYFSMNSTH